MGEVQEHIELQVRRAALRDSQLISTPHRALDQDEVRVKIDRFALTANNVTYGVAGDQIGYWKFFPPTGAEIDQGWGILPVWGLADVVESRSSGVAVGERIYGYFPMASHWILEPSRVGERSWVDGAAHRQALPAVYNRYSRTAAEPPALRELEDERCLFFPLFITSFFLYDTLVDNDFFGADQVLLGSASSKTALGVAHLLHHDEELSRRVVGLTSPGNVGFVENLGTYDEAVPYAELEALDSEIATVFVDMAGSSDVTRRVHEHFGERLVHSCVVGATHWEAERGFVDLPGPEPSFFFAPSQIQKREQDWGPGVAMQRANEASARVARATLEHLEIERRRGPCEVRSALGALLEGEVPPSRGLLLSMHAED